MTGKRLETARAAYAVAFPDAFMPEPFGINETGIAEALERAVVAGQPISPEFDWWADIPPGAVA